MADDRTQLMDAVPQGAPPAAWQPAAGRVRPRWGIPPGWLLWVVWAIAIAAAGHIYFESPDFSSIPGVGETFESHAASMEVARVHSVRVQVGQRVRSGELMVTFDPGPLDLEIVQARAVLVQSEANLEARILQLRRDQLSEERDFEKSIDVNEMGRISAQVSAEIDRAEAEGLRLRIRWWDVLVQKQLVSEQTLQDLKAQLVSVEQRLVAREEALQAWQERLSTVERRRRLWQEAAPSADADPLHRDVAPLRAEVEVARAKLAHAQGRRAGLSVRAAVDGVVSRVLMQPGDVATQGQTVVVLRPAEVRRVIAYALDTVARRLRVGAAVHVQRRDGSGRLLKAHVEGFGGVAELPLQLQSVPPRAPLAAEEIVIVLEEGTLLPGEPVDVAFLEGVLGQPIDRPSETAGPTGAAPPEALSEPPSPTRPGPASLAPSATPAVDKAPGPPSAEAPPSPAAGTQATAEPALIEIPKSLEALAHLEPSGLVWLPERQRFLLISDDTGLAPKDQHAPWVFGMDAAGRVDAAPWRLAGSPAVSDLEAVTRAADGTLWLLCSQSISRKGNRRDPRTWLLQAQLTPAGVAVQGKASLATALGRWHDPAGWRRLGLGLGDPHYRDGAGGFDRTLEIEGMVADGEALLLGLKRPLDSQGRAIIWRLAHPQRLLQSGRVEPQDLQLWAHVGLLAGPGPAPMAAGIADLIRLPDARLAILATALGDGDEGHAELGLHSALYTAGALEGGILRAQLVAAFTGRHAEGVALAPDGAHLTVVFDEAASAPHWLTLPLP